MIIELPKNFTLVNSQKMKDAYVEEGVLKIRRTANYKHVMYEAAFALYGDKHTCRYCGRTFMNKKMTMDHKYPQETGGPTITTNLIPACAKCNMEKTHMTVKQYEYYKNMKTRKEQIEYLKKLDLEKEDIKRQNYYEFPKEWLCTKKIPIIMEVRLEDVDNHKKYLKVKRFYQTYGHFQTPIIVDKHGFLLDGFYTVIFAKKHEIKEIPTIQLENVEVFF